MQIDNRMDGLFDFATVLEDGPRRRDSERKAGAGAGGENTESDCTRRGYISGLPCVVVGP